MPATHAEWCMKPNHEEDTCPIPRFSHSQMNQWDRCRFAWNLSYVGEWTKETKSMALTKGGHAAEFLHAYYTAVKNNEPFNLTQYVQQYVTEKGIDDYQQMASIEHISWLVGRYIDDIASMDNWKILGTELYFEEEFKTPKGRPYLLEGFIDRVVEINGKIWVVDDKTHGGAQYAWKPVEVQMSPQLATYVVVLRKQGYNVHGVMINMLNTYEYKKRAEVMPDKLFSRELSYRTETELDSMQRELGFMVDDIVDNRHSIRRSLNRDCSWCQFQEPCLMDMKGIPIKDFMPVAFVKKEKRPVSERGGELQKEDSGFAAPI